MLIVVKRDGSFQGDLTLDLDALALGVSSEVPSEELYAELDALTATDLEIAIERARDTLLRRVRFRFDGQRAEPDLDFPDVGTERAAWAGEPTMLGTTARFVGRVPEGAQELVFFASRALGPTYVTILDQRTTAGRQFPLQPGEESPVFSLLERDAVETTDSARPSSPLIISIGASPS